MKKLISILLTVCIVVTVIPCFIYAAAITPETTIEAFTEELNEVQDEYSDEPVSNRLIVKSKYEINELDSVDVVEGYNDLHIVQFDNSESAAEALEYYENNKLIEYAEEDALVTILDEQNVSDNQLFGYGNHLSWGSDFIGTDDYIDILESASELPEIIVGIIDTGIELNHEFIKDRIIKTAFNLSDTGIENSENDDNGHGTHVAGIVVDNTTENVKIKSFKCLNSKGSGTLSSIVVAVDEAVESGVNIINMSLGARGKSKALEDSVNAAIKDGITVCVSAGNSGANCSNYVPANIEGCITVAAIGEEFVRPYWSNWGEGIDIIAPGVLINSSYLGNTYKVLSGTSMATPFVTASAALFLSTDLNLSCEEICIGLEECGNNNWTNRNDDTYYFQKPILYIGTINWSEIERTKTPEISIESGYYSDEIKVEITCDEEADIYYTLDGSRCTEDNGTLYTEPITINTVTHLHSMAIAQNKSKSLQAIAKYYITSTDPESNFEINENGIITEYIGNNDYLTIPDTINGITVKGIGDKVFIGSSLVMINLPKTLNSVGYRAFRNCDDLYSFECENLKYIAKEGFYSCEKLTRIDLSNLEEVGDYGFQNCRSILELNNNKLTVVNKYAFFHLDSAININLPNVKRIEMNGLDGNLRLNELRIPNVEYLGRSAIRGMYLIQELELTKLKELNSSGMQFWGFESLTELHLPNCEGEFPIDAIAGSGIKTLILKKIKSLNERALEMTSRLELLYIPEVTEINCTDRYFSSINLRIMFAPKVKMICGLPQSSNATFYFSESLKELLTKNKLSYIIIAPEGSYAKQWAEDNGCLFTDSDTMINAIGTHENKNGVNVFEFAWKNIDDIEQYAGEVKYGDNTSNVIKQLDGVTYFSVESNEPIISGNIEIDGMLFRSAPLSANEHINETEPDNGCAHNWSIAYTVSDNDGTIVVFFCSECDSYYRVNFYDYINTDFSLLDVVEDGIINAKDYAYLLKNYSE